MKEMSLRLQEMVNISSFGKLLVDWFQEKKGQSKEQGPLIQSLQAELQKVTHFLNSLSTDLSENQPLLKTILLSEMEQSLHENTKAELASLKAQIQKQLTECFEAIHVFNQQCQRHNELFEKFVQTYIKNGLPLTGIKLYDPHKKPAYHEVNEQYNLVLQDSQALNDSCKKTLILIQNRLNDISQI